MGSGVGATVGDPDFLTGGAEISNALVGSGLCDSLTSGEEIAEAICG